MITRGRRQLALFLVALMLPSAAIAALAWRVVVLDHESAVIAQTKDRALTKNQIYLAVLARLDQIKRDQLQQISPISAPTSDAVPPAPRDPAVALTGIVSGGQLLFRSDLDPAADRFRRDVESADFSGRIEDGQGAEFKKDFQHAAALYETALQGAANDAQRNQARSLLARALAKAGPSPNALKLDLELLRLPSDVVDEQGMPFAYYAAARLATAGHSREALARLEHDLKDEALRLLSPVGAYRLRDILESLQASDDPHVVEDARANLEGLSATLATFERAESLKARFSAGLGVTSSDWLLLDEPDPWLIGRTESKPAVIIAVEASKVLHAESDRLASRSGLVAEIATGTGGEPLGALLRGLSVTLQPAGGANNSASLNVRTWFYGLSLVLVTGLSSLGGYLVWRDTRREIRMAELRSQFVSSVSHELKTPLTAIRMFAETLQIRQMADPRTHSEYLETIVNESERLSRLLNNVLDFSRIERGEKTYHKQPTRLADIVTAATRALQYPLAQQGFDLRVTIDDDVPAVAVDRDAIEQAILNLLTNAMKYSGQSREIELRLCRENGSAVVQVTDHGIGIPADEQRKIFERFYRVRLPEHQAVAGTGLGLALVAHIANAHGGAVDVHSRPGEGSIFSIHLPVQAATPS